jgi:DNA helicase II / ATP-dependent DNA helicase PcrA
VPQRFYVTQQAEFGDRHLYGSLTRFIPPSLEGCFDTVGAEPARRAHGASPSPIALPMIDVAARVGALWS